MWRPLIGHSLGERVKKMGVWDKGPWMVRDWTGVDGEWWRMESPSKKRGRCGWVACGWVESVKECGCVGLWVQLWGVDNMGFGFKGSGED